MNDHFQINSWRDFANLIRPRGCNLLQRLDEFPNSILVSGCQRSGTTMLSRIITESDDMVNFRFGDDDELDGALIVGGIVAYKAKGRHCFQTTYLNECYHEYYRHKNGYKLVWVLRNPYSVIHSMLHNWDRFALNELFLACGGDLPGKMEKLSLNVLGKYGMSQLRKACYAYTGKTGQLFELKQKLAEKDFLVVEYDRLVANKDCILPMIYDFLTIPYRKEYADKIHQKSIRKAEQLSGQQKTLIKKICEPVYEKALPMTIAI